ncbi:MAG: LysM peptidoglycan-binding domain-containing protein [Actinomycetota bacterium]
MAVAVVFGLLGLVRLSQGTPPATGWAELNADPRVSAQALAGPGDQLHIARPGDTLWSIAVELAPDADPRPVVDALAAANGGTAIAAGQRIVIPGELLATLPGATPLGSDIASARPDAPEGTVAGG